MLSPQKSPDTGREERTRIPVLCNFASYAVRRKKTNIAHMHRSILTPGDWGDRKLFHYKSPCRRPRLWRQSGRSPRCAGTSARTGAVWHPAVPVCPSWCTIFPILEKKNDAKYLNKKSIDKKKYLKKIKKNNKKIYKIKLNEWTKHWWKNKKNSCFNFFLNYNFQWHFFHYHNGKWRKESFYRFDRKRRYRRCSLERRSPELPSPRHRTRRLDL